MNGEVDDRGTAILHLDIGGQGCIAVIDTGFDGYLVLPEHLSDHFDRRFEAQVEVVLGGGQVVLESVYAIRFPFDGVVRTARASFLPVEEALIGTALLADYRLEIDFVARTVALERIHSTV